MAEEMFNKYDPEEIEKNRKIMEASYRRMFGSNWQQAMKDPFMQGRMMGQLSAKQTQEAEERSRGFKVGSYGTGFGR
jgi:hypothetical protein